jgi:hypothetical protein
MKRADVYFVILMFFSIIATLILAYIAVNLGPYLQVYNYMTKHNITGDICGICQELNATGLVKTQATPLATPLLPLR